MTDQERYAMAIQLAETAARVQTTHYELSERLAELALELLGKKSK